MERTLSVGHVEQAGLGRRGARLTLLSLRQLDTKTDNARTMYPQETAMENTSYFPGHDHNWHDFQ